LAEDVKEIFLPPVPVTNLVYKQLIRYGALHEEADLVSFIPATMTIEPFTDKQYDHQKALEVGVYYIVSPKIALNQLSHTPNFASSWTLDPLALSKSDFGPHNALMATFTNELLKYRKLLFQAYGTHDMLKLQAARFLEDDYPLIVVGPLTKPNQLRVGAALETVPYTWVHIVFWRGWDVWDLPSDNDSDDDNNKGSDDN